MPNSLTLTHPYKSIAPNPYFLSPEIMKSLIHSIEPILNKVGVLMFQFEYLNNKKMKSLTVLLDKFQQLINVVDKSIQIGIEIRNANYLNKEYFQFLKENNIAHVFLQGYYMPNICKIFDDFKNLLTNTTVIRLHGYDRKGIEAETNNKWNQIVSPKDDELPNIIKMIKSLKSKDSNLYLNINNHYEGSAPLTIQKIKSLL